MSSNHRRRGGRGSGERQKAQGRGEKRGVRAGAERRKRRRINLRQNGQRGPNQQSDCMRARLRTALTGAGSGCRAVSAAAAAFHVRHGGVLAAGAGHCRTHRAAHGRGPCGGGPGSADRHLRGESRLRCAGESQRGPKCCEEAAENAKAGLMCRVGHAGKIMPCFAGKFTCPRPRAALPVRVVNQRLQPLGKLRRIPRCPGLVDQADVQQINEVHLVFNAECRQLDLDECFQ